EASGADHDRFKSSIHSRLRDRRFCLNFGEETLFIALDSC
ncbi:MAG: hypothetical protein ACI92S_005299, partial [Planctomycetaceae bacterium]